MYKVLSMNILQFEFLDFSRKWFGSSNFLIRPKNIIVFLAIFALFLGSSTALISCCLLHWSLILGHCARAAVCAGSYQACLGALIAFKAQYLAFEHRT